VVISSTTFDQWIDLSRSMDQLPAVLQKEIWEYVRGDRAFWKEQFSKVVSGILPDEFVGNYANWDIGDHRHVIELLGKGTSMHVVTIEEAKGGVAYPVRIFPHSCYSVAKKLFDRLEFDDNMFVIF
jgi:hypothetical protein